MVCVQLDRGHYQTISAYAGNVWLPPLKNSDSYLTNSVSNQVHTLTTIHSDSLNSSGYVVKRKPHLSGLFHFTLLPLWNSKVCKSGVKMSSLMELIPSHKVQKISHTLHKRNRRFFGDQKWVDLKNLPKSQKVICAHSSWIKVAEWMTDGIPTLPSHPPSHHAPHKSKKAKEMVEVLCRNSSEWKLCDCEERHQTVSIFLQVWSQTVWRPMKIRK